MKTTLKNIWKWLNGKKTVIGLGILALTGQDFFANHVHVDVVAAMEWLGLILSGGGLIHKGMKVKSKTVKE